MAMVSSVLAILAAFRDSGFASSIIQRPNITHVQLNTLFWVSVCISLFLMAAACLAARELSDFYNNQLVAEVAVPLTLTLVLGAISGHQLALLRRKMKFLLVARVSILATCSGAAMGLFLAWHGYGVWALIGSTLATDFVATLTAWRLEEWRPSRPNFDRSALSLLSLGGYVTAFSFFGALAGNIAPILLGRMSGPGAVGLYMRSQWLLSLPMQYIVEPIGQAAVPALSALSSNAKIFNVYYFNLITALAFFTCPAAVFSVFFANDIILALLGQKWASAAEIFRWLGISVFLQPICSSAGWIYLALGRGRALMWWGIVGWTLVIGLLALSSPYGAKAVAAAQSASLGLLFLPCMVLAFRSTTLSVKGLLQACWKQFIGSAVAGTITFAVAHTFTTFDGAAQRLIFNFVLFGSAYLFFLAMFPDQRALFFRFVTASSSRKHLVHTQ